MCPDVFLVVTSWDDRFCAVRGVLCGVSLSPVSASHPVIFGFGTFVLRACGQCQRPDRHHTPSMSTAPAPFYPTLAATGGVNGSRMAVATMITTIRSSNPTKTWLPPHTPTRLQVQQRLQLIRYIHGIASGVNLSVVQLRGLWGILVSPAERELCLSFLQDGASSPSDPSMEHLQTAFGDEVRRVFLGCFPVLLSICFSVVPRNSEWADR